MFMVHLIYEVSSLLITNNILSVNISRGHAVYTAILFPTQKTDFLKVEKIIPDSSERVTEILTRVSTQVAITF